MTNTTKSNCPECHGKGYFFCQTCNGTGKCTGSYLHETFFGKRYTVECKNGWCPRCKGTGRDDAIIFNDLCIMCNGTRYCPICMGSSKCPNCQGNGKVTCSSCGRKT